MHRVDNRIARRHLRRGGVALVGATAALVALLGPGAPHAAALTTSTTTVTSSNNPAPAKSTVTYTATVTPSTPTPTGTINFQDGGNTTTCTAQPLSSGTATCVTSYGTPGNYTVTATYGGDATYAGSTGTLAGGETITFLTTTNTVSSSLNPSTAGQQVTYTVQTNPQVHGGSFNFKDGGTTITGCGAQNSSGTGSATCAVTYGSAGSHAITVAYSGDTSYSPQPASNTVTQTVTPPFHPEGVGQPGTAVTPNNTQLVFWQGAGGHLFEAWWNGSWNGPVDWTASAFHGAGPLTSAPTVTVTPGGTQIVFWRGAANHLFEAWWNGAWNGPVDVSSSYLRGAALSSSPSVALTGSTQVVFWQGASGHLFEAWWNGAWNGPVDWTVSAFSGGGALTTAPSVAVTSGTQIVFWGGAANHLFEAWWNGHWNGPVDVTASFLGGGGALTSSPSVALTSTGTQIVFWRGAGNHLDEAWWNGKWNGAVDWTTSAFNGAGPLASAPSAAVTNDGTQIIFWQGGSQSLWEAWFTSHWNGPVDYS